MSNTSLASSVEMGGAVWVPPLQVGDAVCVAPGTPDPDFPDFRLGDWAGEIVEVDDQSARTRYLVQWGEDTMAGFSPFYRALCDHEDVAFDQMWLFGGDLNRVPA